MKISNTTFILVTAWCLAAPALAQISDTTRQSASSFVGGSAPRAAATAPATNDGLMVVDKPFDVPRAEPKLPLQPPAAALPLAAPVRPAPVAAVPAPAPAPAVSEWKIQLSDGFLSRSLRRWEREAKFPILWEAPKDLPAVAAVYKSDFFGALKRLMEDTRHSEYPLHACAYDNAVRILHVSQACTR